MCSNVPIVVKERRNDLANLHRDRQLGADPGIWLQIHLFPMCSNVPIGECKTNCVIKIFSTFVCRDKRTLALLRSNQ
jgi:hypothetical protein